MVWNFVDEFRTGKSLQTQHFEGPKMKASEQVVDFKLCFCDGQSTNKFHNVISDSEKQNNIRFKTELFHLQHQHQFDKPDQ